MAGNTSAQTLLRLEYDVIRLKPSIVVIQVGINDLKTIGVFPENRDKIISSCQKNLKSIVSQMLEHDIHIVILTIFPPGTTELLRRPVWSDKI